MTHSVLQSQNTVTVYLKTNSYYCLFGISIWIEDCVQSRNAYLECKQLLPFGFAASHVCEAEQQEIKYPAPDVK